MTRKGFCALVFLLILCASVNAQCISPEDMEEDVQRDMEDLPLVSEPESEAILLKYARAWEGIRRPLHDAVHAKGCAAEDELLLAGILRMDLDWPPPSGGCSSEAQKSLTAFYTYRTSPSASNEQAVISRIERLHAQPNDGVEILFIPFLDDVDESLRLYALLSEVSDGAMAEMLGWAVGYLAYTHRADSTVFQHIKKIAGEHHASAWGWADTSAGN